ncbi:hypothetical protein MUN88_12530 [Gracilibacillus caseinilyticus]|uniref:YfhD-like protein n=1 Tax=Gracilibacillus caseinilyticus TaxID=2932256 RepID=A0ABY4EXP0_9BACI|nr:hypothetical protein [Gracilibacillus caseinilyticus]UOQ46916.1 hypothetical protein MUN88_12530 [Gracilibacillus caseinilyticus]
MAQDKDNRFDRLMFGKKAEKEEPVPEETDDTFDLIDTFQLLNDTYQKLSPLKDIFVKSSKK